MDLVTRASSIRKQISGTGAHADILATEALWNGK
jgi:hypothetical protein